MLNVILLAGALALAPAGLQGAPEEAADLLGLWLNENGEVAVELAMCGDQLCGRVAWLSDELDANGQEKVDSKNRAAELRARELKGLTVLTEFARLEEGYALRSELGCDVHSLHPAGRGRRPAENPRLRGAHGLSRPGRLEVRKDDALDASHAGAVDSPVAGNSRFHSRPVLAASREGMPAQPTCVPLRRPSSQVQHAAVIACYCARAASLGLGIRAKRPSGPPRRLPQRTR